MHSDSCVSIERKYNDVACVIGLSALGGGSAPRPGRAVQVGSLKIRVESAYGFSASN